MLVNSNAELDDAPSPAGSMGGRQNVMSAVLGGTSSGAENFSELMVGADGEAVSRAVTDSYEVLYGG